MTTTLEAEEIEVPSSHEDRAKALVRRAANLDAESEKEDTQAIDQSTSVEWWKETIAHKVGSKSIHKACVYSDFI